MSYHTLVVQRILLHFRLWHVYNPVYIERDLLGIRRPGRIAEAIGVFAIALSIERIIFVRNRIAEILAVSIGIFDLFNGESTKWVKPYQIQPRYTEHTQKSISRFPLPPNSRSPTWNETVILSSLWRVSWKHSREWALSWMLWAVVAPIQPSMVTRTAEVEKRILSRLRLCKASGKLETKSGSVRGEKWVWLLRSGGGRLRKVSIIAIPRIERRSGHILIGQCHCMAAYFQLTASWFIHDINHCRAYGFSC